jgi:hypothetical protein
MSRADERGYATVFVLGLALVAIAVSGVAIDGTRAFLLRRSLQNAADSAALAAASEIDRAAYYSSGGTEVQIDPPAARARAAEWLGRRGVDAAAVVQADGEGVRVTLRGSVETTFLRVLGVGSVPVAADSTARPMGGPATP